MDDSGGDLMPLVQDVLNDKDGLLFIAGSAKTHLMNGMVQNGGIIPRCFDVISNSIGKLQARITFKPNKMNGFLILSDAHADPMMTRSLRGPALSTHKRLPLSRRGRVLHHRPASLIELDSGFKLKMSRAKLINNLVDSNDLTNPKVGVYTITTQEKDCRGEIETKLFKGDVLISRGGGAQVVFYGVEIIIKKTF